MINGLFKNFVWVLVSVAFHALSAGVTFALTMVSLKLSVPDSYLSGLDANQKFVEVLGNDVSQWLFRIFLLLTYGAVIFVVSGVWFRRINMFGAFVFGCLSGAYCFALLPPLDWFGGAFELVGQWSLDPQSGLIIVCLLLLALISVFPLLAFVSDQFTRGIGVRLKN